ncbi:protein phosphatase 2C domain-containing protein [Pseudosporangium ferrugineum]|nr:protein phosphatase 2C domain-containing protein [Pseudosporangium ferrugineum]
MWSDPMIEAFRQAYQWFFNGDPPPAQPKDPHERFVPANGGVYQSRNAAAGPPPQRQAPPQGAPPQAALPRTAPPEEPPPRERDPWDPPVVGRPVGTFAPRPSTAAAYRPDYVADGWATPRFVVRAASVRGYSHRNTGEPRQDDVAVAWHEPTGAVLFAVADGVSDAPLSHIGATSACRAAIGAMTAGLDGGDGRVDWDGLLRGAAWQLCEQARLSLGLPEIDREAAERHMATTLVAGLVRPGPDGPMVELVQVGDSSAWILNTRVPRYQCLTPTKFRVGDEVFTNAVVALPRVPAVEVRHGTMSRDEVLLVGTDGFGDPLGDGDNLVGDHFSDALRTVPPVLKFANDLDFSRETWDDDRTLFALWPYGIRG